LALPQVCPVATGSGFGVCVCVCVCVCVREREREREGGPPEPWPGAGAAHAIGCCWGSLPSLVAVNTIPPCTGPLCVPPQGLLPRAAPLSVCPFLGLPPPFPGGAWASGWRVDFSSFCKQVVAVCQAGRRQAGAALQPGCAKHQGTALGGDKETPRPRERERERERETFRRRQIDQMKPH
jgi:hypothetical protein